MKITAGLGSISSGTMLKDDLIPCFADELGHWARKNEEREDLSFLKKLGRRMINEDYFDSEESGYDLEELFERLDKYAPPYAYFGAHPSDGSDYGFCIS